MKKQMFFIAICSVMASAIGHVEASKSYRQQDPVAVKKESTMTLKDVERQYYLDVKDRDYLKFLQKLSDNFEEKKLPQRLSTICHNLEGSRFGIMAGLKVLANLDIHFPGGNSDYKEGQITTGAVYICMKQLSSVPESFLRVAIQKICESNLILEDIDTDEGPCCIALELFYKKTADFSKALALLRVSAEVAHECESSIITISELIADYFIDKQNPVTDIKSLKKLGLKFNWELYELTGFFKKLPELNTLACKLEFLSFCLDTKMLPDDENERCRYLNNFYRLYVCVKNKRGNEHKSVRDLCSQASKLVSLDKCGNDSLVDQVVAAARGANEATDTPQKQKKFAKTTSRLSRTSTTSPTTKKLGHDSKVTSSKKMDGKILNKHASQSIRSQSKKQVIMAKLEKVASEGRIELSDVISAYEKFKTLNMNDEQSIDTLKHLIKQAAKYESTFNAVVEGYRLFKLGAFDSNPADADSD